MTELKHLPEDQKFEILVNNQKVGELTYSAQENGNLEIIHTGVDASQKGKGLGKELVQAAVEYARKSDIKLIPSCSFAKAVIAENKDWQNFVVYNHKIPASLQHAPQIAGCVFPKKHIFVKL